MTENASETDAYIRQVAVLGDSRVHRMAAALERGAIPIAPYCHIFNEPFGRWEGNNLAQMVYIAFKHYSADKSAENLATLRRMAAIWETQSCETN